ncbi:MAG: bifunctional methylenetetrahydrofolate dehydrogenase/methenyltetrahydrofolate cyclohydrolase FolD [Oscillospiraceae bacterium]|nr:bifunctional methylenetetrahydrofolate dehydrogenase/methenyltetrahydrofolate cyclohydrolase FolD [Oscillospiraceae bacterium]
MAIILDGKVVSQKVKDALKTRAAKLAENGNPAALAVIIVGDNPASRVYVNGKKRDCEEIGIITEEYALPADATEAEVLELVNKLNNRADMSGILVQLPLPAHINEEKIINAISPDKDVDAFHPTNVGKIMIGNYDFLPCTPAGVMAMLDAYDIPVDGKECVVIGRSNIVGKPQAMLLLHKNGTVTICHSRTKNLAEVTRRADIVVVAIGKAEFLTGDMIKPGAVVIDVGMNKNVDGKLVGDVNFAECEPIAAAITPVPGGVGLMTRAILMENTIIAAEKANNA